MDLFWLTLNTPVSTDKLKLSMVGTGDNPASFREIQVFEVIPEPSALALVGIGLIGTWLIGRRRRA